MKLVEQVDVDGNIFLGYDTSLSANRLFEVIHDYFPSIYKDEDGMICGEYNGIGYSVRAKNITYLGNPHPVYKKRIQIADDLQNFYKRSKEKGMTPILLGIYTCGKNTIFCDFNIEDFINKKAHNSSAHIYSEDLASATTDGYFYKEDYFGNRITAFNKKGVNAFLEEKLKILSPIHNDYTLDHSKLEYEFTVPASVLHNNETLKSYNIKNIVMEFFSSMKKTWYGIECYNEMMRVNYRNKFQPEWPGFYLEFLFEKYLEVNSLNSFIRYAQDKKKGGVDLDLYMPKLHIFGDLKAHSTYSNGIQGNDLHTVTDILKQPEHNHIYYFVGEHETKKDSDYNYVVTHYWNSLQGKDDLMSYSKRMKNNVTFCHAYIFDINPHNMKYLTVFRQGINSNGKPREPKIMLEQKNYSNFILAEREL